MDKELRILILEDVPADAELKEHELRKAGLVFTSKVVDTREAFLKELDEFLPALILSDYDLPLFDGLAALRIAKEKCPDVPFVLVTGVMGEEFAIETLKKGATDYVLKNNLKRLVPSVKRALEEANLITERKQAEEALRESEARYRSYIEVTGQIAWVTNAAGEVIEDVPSLRKFSGQTYEEARGSGWAKALHPDDIDRTLKVWQNAVTARSPYEIEYRMRRHDGVYRDLLARGFPVFSEDGCIREWVGTCIDITERKQAEEEIKMLSSVVKQSTEGMAIAGLDGKLTFVNEAWCRMHGYKSSEELFGKSLAISHNKEQMENNVKPFNEKVIELGAYSGEVWHITKDGKPFPTLMATTLLKDKQGKPYAFAGIAKDITEHKQAEEKIRQKMSEIENLNRLFIGREHRMIELKKEVNSLLERLGQPNKYDW